MKIVKQKKISAIFSVLSNIILITLKFVVGVISNSISVISDAVHSFGDLIASLMALFSVFKSSQPADKDHSFGHYKYEDMSGFIEAILIILTSFYIFYIIYKKISTGTFDEVDTNPGIVVMVISIILNSIVSAFLFKTAKKSDSIALLADAEHLSTDVYNSVAILIGLFLVKITGLYIIDTLFATIIGTITLIIGLRILKKAMNNLLDASLPEKDIAIISHILENYRDKNLVYTKSLQTKKAGHKKIIQLVVNMDGNFKLNIVHKICDDLEREIKNNLKNSEIIVHVEPN